MAFRISGKNMDVGESLRAHVEDKIRTTVSRYFDGTTSGHVVLSKEGSWFRADCGLHLSSGVDLYAESKGQEPYATFDVAAEKIERRLRRYKRRLKDRHGAVDHHVAEGELDRPAVATYTIEQPDEDVEESSDFSPAIVAESTSRLPKMSVATAVAQLDLTGAPVVIFQHAGSTRVNVVYRRRDGAIGWVDPH